MCQFYHVYFSLSIVVGYRWVMFQTPKGTVLFDAVCVPDQFDTFF